MNELGLGIRVANVEEATRQLGSVGAAARSVAETTATAATSNRSFGQSAQETAQRVQGMASQVASLAGHLGGGALGQAAGLVGSLAGVTANALAMGTTMGPGGILVGAITGLIPIIASLANEHDTAAQAARDHATAERQAATDILQARRDLSTQTDIAAGVFGRDISNDQLHTESQTRSTQAFELSQQITLAERRIRRAELNGDQSAAEAVREGLDESQARLETLRTEIDSIDTEIRRREADAGTRAEEAATPPATTTPTAPHRGGSGHPTMDLDKQKAIADQERAAAEYQAYQAQVQIDATDELAAARAEAHDALTQQIEEENGELERQADIRHDQVARYQRDLAHFNEQQRRWDAEDRERRTHQTQDAQQAATAIIGSLTSVFTLMAEGQADAAEGAELLLASFLQYISQRAAIEALAQVAEAVGSYPDPAGMALHAAAALAWGAVAVATGVGGAVLQSDAQSQIAAKHGGEAATSRDTAGHGGVDRDQGNGGGNATFYVYANGFVTKKDTQAALVGAINEAQRSGYPLRQRTA